MYVNVKCQPTFSTMTASLDFLLHITIQFCNASYYVRAIIFGTLLAAAWTRPLWLCWLVFTISLFSVMIMMEPHRAGQRRRVENIVPWWGAGLLCLPSSLVTVTVDLPASWTSLRAGGKSPEGGEEVSWGVTFLSQSLAMQWITSRDFS